MRLNVIFALNKCNGFKPTGNIDDTFSKFKGQCKKLFKNHFILVYLILFDHQNRKKTVK